MPTVNSRVSSPPTISMQDVLRVVQELLDRHQLTSSMSLEASLFAEGLGFDSLQIAELSQLLEARFGSDPFTAGAQPETIGDVVAYYGAQKTS